jgi:hypothetical protein
VQTAREEAAAAATAAVQKLMKSGGLISADELPENFPLRRNINADPVSAAVDLADIAAANDDDIEKKHLKHLADVRLNRRQRKRVEFYRAQGEIGSFSCSLLFCCFLLYFSEEKHRVEKESHRRDKEMKP